MKCLFVFSVLHVDLEQVVDPVILCNKVQERTLIPVKKYGEQ